MHVSEPPISAKLHGCRDDRCRAAALRQADMVGPLADAVAPREAQIQCARLPTVAAVTTVLSIAVRAIHKTGVDRGWKRERPHCDGSLVIHRFR